MNTDPSETFVDNLEWQIRTALRRRERFARPVRGPRTAGLAALVLAALAGGGVGGAVFAQRHAYVPGGIPQEEAELALELARTRVAEIERRTREVDALVEAGLVTQAEARDAQIERDAALRDVDLRSLDLEEVQLAGRAPIRALDAPLVAGRDFVAERLRVEKARAGAELDGARAREARVRTLYEQGLTPRPDVLAVAIEVRRAEGALKSAEAELDARLEYLQGDSAIDRLILRTMLVEAETEVDLARLQHELAVDDLRRAMAPTLKELASQGLASGPELEEMAKTGEVPAHLQRQVQTRSLAPVLAKVREARLDVQLTRVKLRRILRELGEEEPAWLRR